VNISHFVHKNSKSSKHYSNASIRAESFTSIIEYTSIIDSYPVVSLRLRYNHVVLIYFVHTVLLR